MKLKKIPAKTCHACKAPIFTGHEFDANISMEIIVRKENGARMTIDAHDMCPTCASKLVGQYIVDWYGMRDGNLTFKEYCEKYDIRKV